MAFSSMPFAISAELSIRTGPVILLHSATRSGTVHSPCSGVPLSWDLCMSNDRVAGVHARGVHSLTRLRGTVALWNGLKKEILILFPIRSCAGRHLMSSGG